MRSNMKTLTVIGLATLVMLSSFGAQAQKQTASGTVPAISTSDNNSELSRWSALFDTEAPQSERQAAFEKIVALADQGAALQQFLVGAIFRSGKDHPTHLVARDPEKAAIYLSNAAINGQVDAMASMAELSLAQHKALDAMVWAQLFAHYAPAPDSATSPHSSGVKARGYAAKLLRRCMDEGRYTIVQATLNERLQAFVSDYDAHIKKGRGSRAPFPQGEKLEFDGAQTIKVVEYLRDSVRAYYLLGVDENGRVKKSMNIEAWPEIHMADELQPLLGRLRFKKADQTGTETLRWGTLPLTMDYTGTPDIR
jgi:TPR repeat protein